MAAATWTSLKARSGTGLALAVAFPTHREPGILDTAPLLRVPFDVWQPWPPPAYPELTVTAFVASWLAQVSVDGAEVRAVLGSCAGAALACALGVDLGRRAPK